jgi:hypothetical protein
VAVVVDHPKSVKISPQNKGLMPRGDANLLDHRRKAQKRCLNLTDCQSACSRKNTAAPRTFPHDGHFPASRLYDKVSTQLTFELAAMHPSGAGVEPRS